MARLRTNFQFGTIKTGYGLSTSSTTLVSDELVSFPSLNQSNGDYIPIVLSPSSPIVGVNGPEICYVTTHTTNNSSATIIRACEGTTAQAWNSGTIWAANVTAEDFTLENLILNGVPYAVSGNKAWGWQYGDTTDKYGTDTVTIPPLYSTPNVAKSGAYSICITAQSGGACSGTIASQPFSIVPGEVVNCDFYTKTSLNTVTTGYVAVQYWSSNPINGNNPTIINSTPAISGTFYNQNIPDQVSINPSTNWELTSIQSQAPVGAYYAVLLIKNIVPNGGVPGSVYFNFFRATKYGRWLGPPTGAVIDFCGLVSAIPTGFIAADGSQYSVLQYGTLFNRIGLTYTPGPLVAGIFKVPNYGGIMSIGANSEFAIGNNGGAMTASYTPTIGNLPIHNHIDTTGHTHQAHGNGGSSHLVYTTPSSSLYLATAATTGHATTVSYASSSGNDPEVTFSTIAVGAAGSHSPNPITMNIMNPYLVVNKIIKV